MICRNTANGHGYERLLEILSQEGLRVITPRQYVRVLRTPKDLHKAQCTRCGRRYFISAEKMGGTASFDEERNVFFLHCDDCLAVMDGLGNGRDGDGFDSHRSQKRLRRQERRARQKGHCTNKQVDSRDRHTRIANKPLVHFRVASGR